MLVNGRSEMDCVIYFIDVDGESIHKERLLCRNQRDARTLGDLRARELSEGEGEHAFKFRVLGITEVLAATCIRRRLLYGG